MHYVLYKLEIKNVKCLNNNIQDGVFAIPSGGTVVPPLRTAGSLMLLLKALPCGFTSVNLRTKIVLQLPR